MKRGGRAERVPIPPSEIHARIARAFDRNAAPMLSYATTPPGGDDPGGLAGVRAGD
jgi:hypothetical protein